MIGRGPMTPRRRALLAVLLLVLAWLGWSWWAGMAITAGLDKTQMDWDGNGIVSGDELWQSVYAVSVVDSQDGTRSCRQFVWRRSGEVIRVECRTTLAP